MIESFACVMCGAVWEREMQGGRKPKYCSTECKHRTRRLPEEIRSLVCEVCDQEWSWKVVGGGVPKTCSPGCYAQRRSAIQKRYRENNPDLIRGMKRAYWEKNKDRLMAKRKNWVKRNPEKALEYSRKYRENNPEKRKETSSRYYENNRDEILEKRRELYRTDPAWRERKAQSGEEWRKKNPDKVQAIVERRRARKLNAFVEDVSLETLLAQHDHKCGICGGDIPKGAEFGDPLYPNLDHIVPLSKGGEHSYANAQPSHASCNVQKGDMLEGWQDIKPILHRDGDAA